MISGIALYPIKGIESYIKSGAYRVMALKYPIKGIERQKSKMAALGVEKWVSHKGNWKPDFSEELDGKNVRSIP